MPTTKKKMFATLQQTQDETPLQNSDMELRKASQIVLMVEELFAIQDTYGLTTHQLKIRMKAMVEDLKEYPLELIEGAFVNWRRSSPKIPTPSDIRSLIQAKIADKNRYNRLMEPNNFPGCVNDYDPSSDTQRKEMDDIMNQIKLILKG